MSFLNNYKDREGGYIQIETFDLMEGRGGGGGGGGGSGYSCQNQESYPLSDVFSNSLLFTFYLQVMQALQD